MFEKFRETHELRINFPNSQMTQQIWTEIQKLCKEV